MVRARIIEKYIHSDQTQKRQRVNSIVHETRYFSSQEKFEEWFNSFKEDLWQDDMNKVDMVEGIYVEAEEVRLDDMEKPAKMSEYATFRPGVSYHYAA